MLGLASKSSALLLQSPVIFLRKWRPRMVSAPPIAFIMSKKGMVRRRAVGPVDEATLVGNIGILVVGS